MKWVCVYTSQILHAFFIIIQGVPHHIRPRTGLNFDLRDKSENLRRRNNFDKLIRLIEFFWQKMLDFLV